MSRRAAASSEQSELLSFATDFWGALGAGMTREGRAYRVDLPEALRGHFGRDSLKFVLTPGDAWIVDAEILAPGSFLLELMFDYMKDKGTRAVFHLPATDDATAAAVRKRVLDRVRVAGARVGSVASAEVWPVRLAIDFKLVYQSDDLEEELVRVVEDEAGELTTCEVDPRVVFAGAEVAPGEVVDRVSMAGVAERYDGAVAVVRRFAMERARSIEKKAMTRLSGNLARIRGYFGQVRLEIGDDERRAERLAELDVEERLKTEEEIDSHRVRVRIVPVTMALLAVPTRRVTMRYERDGAGAELVCDWSLADGRLRSPLGPIPAGGIDLDLCRLGHIVNPGDAGRCGACGGGVCTAHAAECPGCGRPLCRAAAADALGAEAAVGCGELCLLCERRFCGDHAPRPCVRCGRATCVECGARCAACGAVACRDHGTSCGVCAARVCGDHALSCACGTTVCPDHVVVDAVSQIRYCARCAVSCHDCGTLLGKSTSQLCAACGARLCLDHALACEACGRASRGRLCNRHRTRCNACARALCRAKHRKRCRLCAQDACGDCLDAAGRCRLCRDLHKAASAIAALPLVEPPDEARDARRWRARSGCDFDLYLGELRAGHVLLVVDKAGAVVKVVRR